MATIYVGPSSAGSANGTSWANRYGSISAAEAKPVAAGDTVYVGPGVYRELLTIGVSGSNGSPITYIADVSGENTDGVGGIVRVTGSDNDTTATRASCITATSKNYRTFRGFTFDTTTANLVSLITSCSNWIIEDCNFTGIGANSAVLSVAGTGTTNTIRRCVFLGSRSNAILFTHTSTVDNSAHLVENCLLVGTAPSQSIAMVRVGGVTIKNCLVLGSSGGIRVTTALSVGQTTTVNNCIILYCNTALQAITAPGTNEEITENYNALWGNNTDRTNVSTGANSNAFPPLLLPPTLLSGFRYPWNPFALSQWSPLRAIAGTSMSADDLLGITRPVTDSKKSWGAVQFMDINRETTTIHGGTGSLKLADAGRHTLFAPTSNVSTTFSVYARYEANYAGTLPSMIIRQPGQTATVVTMAGASGQWELLTTTLTPAASPGYVQIDLRSSNTATSGSFASFFDDLAIT